MNSRESHFNRNGRRSGGDRLARIPIGPTAKTTAILSIQCYEQRHGDCTGHCPMFGHKCDCKCHPATQEAKP